MMSERPLVRTDGIVAEKLDDGLVIYDDTTQQAHARNGSAARLWSLADSRRTLTDWLRMLSLMKLARPPRSTNWLRLGFLSRGRVFHAARC